MTAVAITKHTEFARSAPRQSRTGLSRRSPLAASNVGGTNANGPGGSALWPRTARHTEQAQRRDFSRGIIGAALLRAARTSAGISHRTFARHLAVPAGTVRNWENGTTPLYLVDYSVLLQIANILSQADGAVGLGVSELVIASQCDLLIAGMLDGSEDYAEVPPIEDSSTNGRTARELLGWALTGTVPSLLETPGSRHGATPDAPLLGDPELDRITAMAESLRLRRHGDGLASFGQALSDLIRT